MLTAFDAAIGGLRLVIEVDDRVLTKVLDCAEGQQRKHIGYFEHRLNTHDTAFGALQGEAQIIKGVHHLILKNSARTASIVV